MKTPLNIDLKDMLVRFSCANLALLAFLLFSFTAQIQAITQNDVDCANAGGTGGTCNYDPTECSTQDGGSGTGPDAGDGSGSGKIWNSGLQEPYIVEQFAIELLKNIATKTNVDPSETVTKQHVLALVSFAHVEGGDTANSDNFNPFNSGWPDKELLDGAHSVSGVQSFKSFDAGVEATARHMTTGVQSRLGGVLSKKDTSASDFFKTLLNFRPYNGKAQKSWAQPPPALSYYLSALNSVKNNYKDYASLRLGAGHNGEREPSKLDSSIGIDSGTSTDSPSDPTAGDTSGGCNNQCPTVSANSGGKVIAIDPGHGPSKTIKDSETGLNMVEQPGGPGEMKHVWNVSQIMKKDLESAGYKVVLTKKDINDEVTFRGRANIVDQSGAVLALSIHGDSSLQHSGEVYPQRVGDYRGKGSDKTEFKLDDVAKDSQKYSEIFVKQRKEVSKKDVELKHTSFDTRGGGMEPGNIPMVQLFSKTPWVYNEKKQPFDDDEYAKELVASVKEAVPLSATEKAKNSQDTNTTAGNTGVTSDPTSCSQASGTAQAAVQKAIEYSWPTYHKAPYFTFKPSYRKAIDKAISKGEYVGGGIHPGIDCGGFVTRVMRDSGADPNYNWGPKSGKEGNTFAQRDYMNAHPGKYKKLSVKSTKDLEPGDIAINDTHTYMFVGSQPNFKGDAASASWSSTGLSWRTPMASSASDFANYTWYRLKSGG